jgi:hypothetical protein
MSRVRPINRSLGPQLFRLFIERRKIAKENVEFSLRNYVHSAETASALGVNPKYAQWLVGAATLTTSLTGSPAASKQSTSDESGFGFLKLLRILNEKVAGVVVNASLHAGLMQLAPLKREGGVMDTRVQRLRDLVRMRQTLGLIFPKEDLLFNYSHESTMASPVDLRPQLIIGQRVPHVWLTIDPAGFILSALGYVNEEFTGAVSYANKFSDLSQRCQRDGVVGDDQIQQSHARLLQQYVDYLKFTISLDARTVRSVKTYIDGQPRSLRYSVALFKLLVELDAKCELLQAKVQNIPDKNVRDTLVKDLVVVRENLQHMQNILDKGHEKPMDVRQATNISELGEGERAINNGKVSHSIGSSVQQESREAASDDTGSDESFGEITSYGDRLEYFNSKAVLDTVFEDSTNLLYNRPKGTPGSVMQSPVHFSVSSTYLSATVPMIELSEQLQRRSKQISATIAKSKTVGDVSKPAVFVLCVPAQHLMTWCGALNTGGLSHVVKAVGIVDAQSSIEQVGMREDAHKRLQKTLKYPQVLTSEDSTEGNQTELKTVNKSADTADTCLLKHYELYESLRARQKLGPDFVDGLAYQNLLHLKDTTGKWDEICRSYATKSDKPGYSSKIAVMIRPDGHVCSISNAAVGAADMKSFLGNFRSMFFLKRKGGMDE